MTKSDDKRVPVLRFKGFTDEWEQHKLNSFLVEYKKKTKINNQYPVLTSSRQGIFFQKDYYDGNQIASKNNIGYNIVPRNYFTYRHMSDDTIFHFNINTLCDYGIVSTLYPVFTTNNQLSSSWLYYYLNYGNDMKRYALLQKQGGSRTYMYLSKLKNMSGHIPSVKEQDNVAKMLLKIDNLIALQQRKEKQIKLLKKAMLQTLFTTKTVPQLSFKGFTDNWEQRKLGDVLSKFDYGLNSASSDYDGKNKYLRITDIDEQTHRFNLDNLTSPKVDLKNKDNYILHPGDIVFARTGASVGKTYKYREDDGRVYFAGFLIRGRINKNFDTSFIFDTTLLPKYSNFVEITSIRSGQPGINSEEYKKYVINIPTINEQKYISKLITNLEELITLQQNKTKKLENLKQFLLQNMFI